MYLVKSCFKKDHVKKRRTLKIGSLIEYRDTELEQIADKEEGTIRINYNLKNFHIPTKLFNFINYYHHSDNSAHINYLVMEGPSAIIPGAIVLNDFSGTYSLKNFNRFIFCISLLDNQEDAKGIFPDYDDYWHINANHTKHLAEIIAHELLSTIKIKIASQIKIFEENPNAADLSVRWYVKNITYADRVINIGNYEMYTNAQYVVDSLQHTYMIKPKTFAKEKEIRFAFDIYEGNKLLHPLDKSIIIDASPILFMVK
ncbi:hypothetical protein [Klebsiella pneumoniae]|uniref:hypothetical protein n=1 Tax=Klebsiella pneumoniae TaxID=573 RepID=UPI00058F0636|nr:hypothetical protein [Klebsiella pneumoniae]SWK44092.1 Uncharacterised protein [Klebsiella pneumoniae]VGB90067.1 Uncharacterised protein [Klebsiella pneumoniae]HBY2235297.1 hypothetical protein [Klebsiella pneumoniae]